ncbi:LysR family transcriptional regulator [Xanthobacter versatilis]|uniref:LysR family transcriptional regulator n=1 Tax=Xanthobacter autotrophicus (strain ATCC BAA-1158 / Py2) TaxID=78245 RepID=UPI00372863D9
MPTLKQLEALRWIAVLGGFEKAAERLNTTQSAISKRIQELEAVLDASIFERSGRGARLTAKGQVILSLAEKMLSTRDEIVSVGSSQATAIRQLSFGVTELTALTWLPAFVGQLRAAYPTIVLEPEVEMSVDLVESLTNGKLDFIVVPDSFWRPGFKVVPLTNVQNAWMCSPELMYERGLMRIEDLAKFSILTQGGRSGSGVVVGKWLEECGVDFPRQIKSNSLVALVGLTMAAIGISYLPLRCFQALVDEGSLRIIETDPPLPTVTYVVMFRGDEAGSLVSTISNMARATCDFTRPIRWA